MEKSNKIIKAETPEQRNAFLIYFNLGEKRSLKNACREISKNLPKTVERVSFFVKLKVWSKKYNWVKRCETMDKEVAEKTEAIAIKNATVKKSEILKAVQDTMVKYSEALLSGKVIPASKDYKNMWEILRVELGKDTGQTPLVKIEINKKVLNIINEAENKTKQVIEAEIQDD